MSTRPARRGFHRSEEGAGSIGLRLSGLARSALAPGGTAGLADGGLGEGETGDGRAAADHGAGAVAGDLDVRLDEAQRGELLQRDLEQFGLRAGVGDALAPVARVRPRRLPD